MEKYFLFFNKFLFLFLSNLQTQLLNSKKHRNFLQEKQQQQQRNNKKVGTKMHKHAYKHVLTVLLVKSPSHPVAFSFPLNSIYDRNNNNNNNRQS